MVLDSGSAFCRFLMPSILLALSILQYAECMRQQVRSTNSEFGVDRFGDLPLSTDKKHTLDKNTTGSPTNAEMKKIDKAVKNKQKVFFQWPLLVRLLIVGSLLSIPVFIIAIFIRTSPPEEDLASNVFVKTSIHCGFAFSIGWINCIMLLRYKVFATMMVGNTILMGVAFVCNGGFATAKEQDWWTNESVELCPAQFENAGHYILMIFLFLFGTFCHGLFYKRWGWSSRVFAPVCAAIIIFVEAMEYMGISVDSRYDVYMLSPAFGMIVSISQHCGVGGVPWAATGNMSSAGFNLASVLCAPWSTPRELEKVLVNFFLWISFVAGICIGTLFHSNRTVIFNAFYLSGLLYLNGFVFQPSATDPSSAKALETEHDQQDGGCVFRPSVHARVPLPHSASWQVFVG